MQPNEPQQNIPPVSPPPAINVPPRPEGTPPQPIQPVIEQPPFQSVSQPAPQPVVVPPAVAAQPDYVPVTAPIAVTPSVEQPQPYVQPQLAVQPEPQTNPFVQANPQADQQPQDPQQPELGAANSLEQSQDQTAQQSTPTPLPDVEPVQWQAAEYIQHEKTPTWYVGFIAVVVVLMVAAILIMQTWTFAVLIPVMAVALMVYTHRPPRLLNYVLSQKGLHINDQLHPMGEFKSFGVIQESERNTLVFVPVKRFKPGLTVFFPSEAGEQIVDLLGGYLPMRDEQQDIFDRIVRKLRI